MLANSWLIPAFEASWGTSVDGAVTAADDCESSRAHVLVDSVRNSDEISSFRSLEAWKLRNRIASTNSVSSSHKPGMLRIKQIDFVTKQQMFGISWIWGAKY